MAYAANDWTDGQAGTVEQQYELKVNIGNGYETLCNIGLTEQYNDETESWKTLCGEGLSSNQLTGLNYKIAVDAKVHRGSLAEKIAKNAHDINLRANVPVRLDNTLTNIRKEFTGLISLSEQGGGEGSIAAITGEILVATGKVNVIDGIPEGGTGSILNIYNESADSVDVLYTAEGANLEFVIYEASAPSVAIQNISVSAGNSVSETISGLTSETEYKIDLVNDGTVLDTDLFTTAVV